jgi:pyruvate dehydrogenase E2 component (dihydrolipoamide acetyltransferase)
MSIIEVKVPDIGDFKDIPIIEVHVKPGDTVKAEDPLITLESEKATMEVPAPSAGQIAEVLVKPGDRVSEGTAIAKLTSASPEKRTAATVEQSPMPPPAASTAPLAQPKATSEAETRTTNGRSPVPPPALQDYAGVHASPAVRRLARELEIDLTTIKGSGENGRITKEDVKRALVGSGAASGGMGIPEIPAQDFSKFGPIDT